MRMFPSATTSVALAITLRESTRSATTPAGIARRAPVQAPTQATTPIPISLPKASAAKATRATPSAPMAIDAGSRAAMRTSSHGLARTSVSADAEPWRTLLEGAVMATSITLSLRVIEARHVVEASSAGRSDVHTSERQHHPPSGRSGLVVHGPCLTLTARASLAR